MALWQQILTVLGSAAAITTGLVLLAEKLVNEFFDRRMVDHKNEVETKGKAMLTVLENELSRRSSGWLEAWKNSLAEESSLRVEAYKSGLSNQSAVLVESLKAGLAAESAVQIETLKSNLAIEQQLAFRLAEYRQPAYKALWALQERLSPADTTPLTGEVRKDLNAALTSWYYRDGNGLFLSLAAGDLFLKAKDLLLADPHQVPDGSLKEAFSKVRTQMKTDLSVYDEMAASVKIGI